MAKFVIYAGVCSVGSDSLGPMACSLPRFSTHGIFQARMLEWVAISSSRGSSQTSDQTRISCVSFTGRWILLPLVPQVYVWISKGKNDSTNFRGGKLWRMRKMIKIHEFKCSVQFISVTQSCPTLCSPMNHSMPGLPVHHQLLVTQTHIHRVSDAIQPSHPLLSPSSPVPNPSQHQGLFQWVNSLHQVAKVLELKLLLNIQLNITINI